MVPHLTRLTCSLYKFWLNDYTKPHLTDQKDEESLFKAVKKLLENIPKEEF